MAIPTLFDVLNSLKMIESQKKSVYERISLDPTRKVLNEAVNIQTVETENSASKTVKPSSQEEELLAEIAKLNAELEKIEQDLKKMTEILEKIFNQDQIIYLTEKHVNKWSSETLIKSLKMRFALGLHGYNFLRNYLIPAYSTLMEKIRTFKLQYGVLDDILQLINYKIKSMTNDEKFYMMSVDEMQISEQLDYDKNAHECHGFITFGDNFKKGTHLCIVMIRGIKTNWKQVIAVHITGSSIPKESFKYFIQDCIISVESVGLNVVSLTTDMGPSNADLWNSLHVGIKRGIRVNSFECNSHEVFIFPDVCNLLKNLKSIILKNDDFVLPSTYDEMENLNCVNVSGSNIKKLWTSEMLAKKEIRSLYHLKEDDIFPDNFQKMNVGAAIKFFFIETSAAIESAISMNVLPSSALTTAKFVMLIHQWFQLVNSKARKTSVTERNKDTKFALLIKIIDIFNDITIGNCWKPANTGFILASLFLVEISDFLLEQGFDFVLLHRFTQDAVENIFSQVRRQTGLVPSALYCLKALRLISLSQYMSDVKNTSYVKDDDIFLLNFMDVLKEKQKSVSTNQEVSVSYEKLTNNSVAVPLIDCWDLQISKLLNYPTYLF